MSKKRRKILIGLGVSSASSPWAKPLINHIILPAHADCSPALDKCIALHPRVEVRDAVCVPGSPSTVTFEMCNLEDEAIIATHIQESSADFAQHVSPPLPFELEPGQCVSCSAQGVTATEFDCSDDFSFSYVFTSESGKFEGTAGNVPLVST